MTTPEPRVTLKPRPSAGVAARPFDGATFMVTNYLLGALIGVIFSAAILATDTGHLRTLMMGDGTPWLPVALLTSAMAFTFAGLYDAVSIMLAFRGDPSDRFD